MKAGVAIAASVLAIAAAVLADFAISLVWQPSGAPAIEKPYVARNHGWYELRPLFNGFDQFGPYVYPVETDAYGFRRKPGAATPASSEVIFLGDSFVYGMNGAWEDTFVGMYADASGRRVINAGVASYSPTAYLYQYEKALAAGLLPRGHLVVVGVDVSDVQDEAGIWVDGESHPVKRSVATAAATSSGEPRARPEDAITPSPVEVRTGGGMTWVDMKAAVIDRLPNTWRIYRFVRYDLLGWGRTSLIDLPRSAFTFADWHDLDATPADPGLAGYGPLGVRGGLNRIEAKLLAIMARARAHDARVYLLIYPWPAQVARPDRFSWSSYMADVCRQGSCAGVIDVIPEFRQLAAGESDWLNTFYVSGDSHFSRAGNRVIANALARALPATGSDQTAQQDARRP
jgi:hypothetical protein